MDEHLRHLDYLRVKDLVPAERNPKRHDVATIKASMDRFGYTTPAEIDERTAKLVSGHGRVETLLDAEAAGIEPPEGVEARDDGWYMPVLRGWSSKDDAEAEAYIIAANRIPESGGWDMPDLSAMLADIENLQGVGFTEIDVADFHALYGDVEPIHSLSTRGRQTGPLTVSVNFRVPAALKQRWEMWAPSMSDEEAVTRLCELAEAAEHAPAP